MKKIIALAELSAFALAACKDNTQAQLEQQQKQIEALQQQLAQQNGQQDNTFYQQLRQPSTLKILKTQ